MGRTPTNKILDAGIEKYLYPSIMNPEHLDRFINEVHDARRLSGELDWLRSQTTSKNKGTTLKFKEAQEKWEATPDLVKSYIYENPFKIKDSTAIARYMGITPFYPSVMINISPNWKGRFSNYKVHALQDAFDVRDFKAVIEKYLTSNDRYTKWKYCLECGSEGNFLHAHIVAQINPRNAKSVITHINKGNHTVELRKHWDKLDRKGIAGLLKGKFAIQRVMIRNREILGDKLNYLYEANKPEGHRNLTDLEMVYGDF